MSGVKMSVKKRIIMITCIVVAALFLSQAVLASPVEGTKFLQKIRQNKPVRTVLKEKIANSELSSKIKEKITEFKSILEKYLTREKLASLNEKTIKEILKSDTFKTILSAIKTKNPEVLSWFPGIILVAAIIAAGQATILTYILPIVSSPAPVLTAFAILLIRLCPIIKWIPKTIWFTFFVGQFGTMYNYLLKN